MKKDYTFLYSFFPLLTWGGFAVIIVYALNWFEVHGVNAGLFSVIMSVSYIFAFAAQIILGELITTNHHFSLKRVIITISLLALFCGLVLCFEQVIPPKISLLLFSVIVCCTVIYPSLVNSLAIYAPYEGFAINFGIARGIGAIGFSAFSYIVGKLISVHGTSVIIRIYIFVSISFIILSLIFPNVKSDSFTNKKELKNSNSILKNRMFILLLIGSTCIYIGQNYLSTYMLKVVERIDGDAGTQGIVIALAAFCEMPAMFLFTKMRKKGRCDTYLKLSGIFMLIRTLGCILAPSKIVMYALQFTQLMGYGLFCVASTEYVNIFGGKENAVRGQSLLASTSSMGSFLVYVLCGILLHFFDLSILNWVNVMIVATGTLIFFFAAKNLEK